MTSVGGHPDEGQRSTVRRHREVGARPADGSRRERTETLCGLDRHTQPNNAARRGDASYGRKGGDDADRDDGDSRHGDRADSSSAPRHFAHAG